MNELQQKIHFVFAYRPLDSRMGWFDASTSEVIVNTWHELFQKKTQRKQKEHVVKVITKILTEYEAIIN